MPTTLRSHTTAARLAAQPPPQPKVKLSGMTSTEHAYETSNALAEYERVLAGPPIPRNTPDVAYERYDLTWSDKVSVVPRMRPKWNNTTTYLQPDSRSPPNFARGSHDVQNKDSSILPNVEEHDMMMRYLGHTHSSDRAPRARNNLW